MRQAADETLAGSAPVPVPDADSANFWAATLEHRLSLPRCSACDLVVFYPRARCPRCRSAELAWETLSGSGSIYAFTVVHRAPEPALADQVPYIVALVDLDEGPRLMTNIVDCEPGTVRVGMRVSVAFRRVSDDAAVPVFRPETDGVPAGG